MSESLSISPNIGGAVVTAAHAAMLRRDELLKEAGSVTTVIDRLDAEDATNTLKSLKEYTRGIDAERITAKAPALELGRKIDALAKTLTTDVEFEAVRISRVLGSFEANERAKAEDERRKAEAEVVQIAEQARKQAIAARQQAVNPLAADRAVDSIVEQAAVQVVAVRQAAVNAMPAKQAGTQIRGTICFEVTDIKALYADNPLLVNMEPNGAAIRAIIKQNPNIKLPGLTHWLDHKLSV